MKSLYFSKSNIKEVSQEMLREISKYSRVKFPAIFPDNPALLIIDMQEYFLNKNSHAFLPSAPAIVNNIKMLTNFFINKGFPIFSTQHINNASNAKMLGRWWADVIEEDTPLNKIIPDLIFEQTIIIHKTQYDAFYNTQLEKLLNEKKVKQLVICGVMTHLCCETTARSGFVRGYEIIFPIDATATQNQKFHISTLINLSHGFANIALSSDLVV